MNAKTEAAMKPLSFQDPAAEAFESIWESSGYPSAIRNRLVRIDRKVHALNGLHELIDLENRNRDWAGDCDEDYSGLSRRLLENLRLAQTVLFDDLIGDLEEIREARNKYGDAILKPERAS